MKHYSRAEERINVVSHLAGLILAACALVALVVRASLRGTAWHVVAVSIFGSSLIVLFAASTIYHGVERPALKSRLRVVDHASIYLLIAGTYTPFALLTLNSPVGWVVFGMSWSLAATGIVLKLFFTGRYQLLSTLMYLFMGWMIVFFIRPLVHSLPSRGTLWLVVGGVCYTVGAALYGIKKVRFNHALFHLFVLFGSASHFASVFLYVLPRE